MSYESHLLGSRSGLLASYCLEVLVLHLFSVFKPSQLRSPLQVLVHFLKYFSCFQWEFFAVTACGPLPLWLLKLAERHSRQVRQQLALQDQHKQLLILARDGEGEAQQQQSSLQGGAERSERPSSQQLLPLLEETQQRLEKLWMAEPSQHHSILSLCRGSCGGAQTPDPPMERLAFVWRACRTRGHSSHSAHSAADALPANLPPLDLRQTLRFTANTFASIEEMRWR